MPLLRGFSYFLCFFRSPVALRRYRSIFSHKFFSIWAKHGWKSRAPSQWPITSPSHDPLRNLSLPCPSRIQICARGDTNEVKGVSFSKANLHIYFREGKRGCPRLAGNFVNFCHYQCPTHHDRLVEKDFVTTNARLIMTARLKEIPCDHFRLFMWSAI